jgi:hypothetical protein
MWSHDIHENVESNSVIFCRMTSFMQVEKSQRSNYNEFPFILALIRPN